MLDTLTTQLELSIGELGIFAFVVLVAGMVRGFAGFGLSAMVMASITFLIPPIALIPVCFVFETVASMIMFRGGLAHGNRQLVLGLMMGYTVGIPFGLMATRTLMPEISSLLALALIFVLATLHLAGITPPPSESRTRTMLAGLLSGVFTGLASLGGMVIALFMLSTQIPTREVRASLVLFLLAGFLISAFWLASTGTLNVLALKRGLSLAPVLVAGVYIGTWLFQPSLERFYKKFCLYLLLGLATVGLGRMLVL